MARACLLFGLLLGLSACSESAATAVSSTASSGASGAASGTSVSVGVTVTSSSSSGGGGSDPGWTPVPNLTGCQMEYATGPAQGLPDIAWVSCGDGCQRLDNADWAPSPKFNGINFGESSPGQAAMSAVMLVEGYVIAAAWRLPSFDPLVAYRTSTASGCVPHPIALVDGGFWAGVQGADQATFGFTTFDDVASFDEAPEPFPSRGLIYTPGTSSVVLGQVSAGTEYLRWFRGAPTAESFLLNGDPPVRIDGGFVIGGKRSGVSGVHALADQSTTTTLLWDAAPKQTAYATRSPTHLVWLDITDELTDTVVHWAPIPAAGATSITPTQSMSIGDVKGVVIASERYAVIGVNDGGYVVVDRIESTVTTAQLPSGTIPFAPEYVGTTPLSPHEEAWIREATNMYRLRLDP